MKWTSAGEYGCGRGALAAGAVPGRGGPPAGVVAPLHAALAMAASSAGTITRRLGPVIRCRSPAGPPGPRSLPSRRTTSFSTRTRSLIVSRLSRQRGTRIDRMMRNWAREIFGKFSSGKSVTTVLAPRETSRSSTVSTQTAIRSTGSSYKMSLPISVTSAAVGRSPERSSAGHNPHWRMPGSCRPNRLLVAP